MDDKLRNIEETERAKKKILDERIKGVNSSAFIVDTSSDKGYARIDAKVVALALFWGLLHRVARVGAKHAAFFCAHARHPVFSLSLCALSALFALAAFHCFIFLPYRHPTRLQASSFFGGPMLTQSVCGCGRVRQAKKKRGSSKRPVDDKPAMDARFFPRPSTFPLHAQLNTSPPAASYYLLESHVNDPRSVSSHAQLATGTGGNFSANFVQRGGNREVLVLLPPVTPPCLSVAVSSTRPPNRSRARSSLPLWLFVFCYLRCMKHMGIHASMCMETCRCAKLPRARRRMPGASREGAGAASARSCRQMTWLWSASRRDSA